MQTKVTGVCERIVTYLSSVQDYAPGEYYGSFWSEKGYHGPLLDYHAGGSHHHRTAGSASLALWLVGCASDDPKLKRQAELGFDWLVARQSDRGGFTEIQNHEKPADWEQTGLEELSSIATGFAVHGLANALLNGLPPKKSYMDMLLKAGHWQLSLEWPAGSGVFPHHERSPYNTLNAATHAAETLAAVYVALSEVYGRTLNIFLQGAARAVTNVLSCQWDTGCFPYRDYGHVTINYTSLVMWCLFNVLDILPIGARNQLAITQIETQLSRAADFLRHCIGADGALEWDANETSTAKHNMWSYIITVNVLLRNGRTQDRDAALKLLNYALSIVTPQGLLPMRDHGEIITECAFMQADMLLFLLPFSGLAPKT